MKLFFDEDNGTGIPKALTLVRLPQDEIHYPSNRNHQVVKRGAKDRDWIPVAGEQGWLVFSQNKWMVNNEEERLLLVRHRVGIVYLDSGNDRSFLVMKLLLRKWDWLQTRDLEDRPFAHLMALSGHSRRLDLHTAMPLGPTKSGRAIPAVGRPIGGTASVAAVVRGAAQRLRLPER